MIKQAISSVLKWTQTVQVAWSELFVYRVDFFLRIIGPMLVFFFIKYSIWSSIYQNDPNQVIGGYTLHEMLRYHLWFLIVALLSLAYNSVNLAQDIRLGKISSYLIYPFSLWEFHAARFLSLQLIQMGIALITISAVYGIFGGWMNDWDNLTVLRGFVLCLFISVFWFAIQYVTGLLAFWLEETWTLRVIVNYLVYFLSGAIIPLELYPQWIVDILAYTPFPYMGHIPVRSFMGDEVSLTEAFISMSLWIFLVALLASWIWKRGLRLYTAAGM